MASENANSAPAAPGPTEGRLAADPEQRTFTAKEVEGIIRDRLARATREKVPKPDVVAELRTQIADLTERCARLEQLVGLK